MLQLLTPLADSHSVRLRSAGVGAAASKYEKIKHEKYEDIKGDFSPFVVEVHVGFLVPKQKRYFEN